MRTGQVPLKKPNRGIRHSDHWIKAKNRQHHARVLDQFLMPGRIRIIRHEPVPQSGSYEVRFADGRASRFYYYDDVLARRLRPETLASEQALEQAKALARAEGDKGGVGDA